MRRRLREEPGGLPQRPPPLLLLSASFSCGATDSTTSRIDKAHNRSAWFHLVWNRPLDSALLPLLVAIGFMTDNFPRWINKPWCYWQRNKRRLDRCCDTIGQSATRLAFLSEPSSSSWFIDRSSPITRRLSFPREINRKMDAENYVWFCNRKSILTEIIKREIVCRYYK